MAKVSTIAASVFSGWLYLLFTLGAFFTGWQGLYPPEVTATKGVVAKTDCKSGGNDYAWFRLEGRSKKFYPLLGYFSNSCKKFDAMVFKGEEVEFLATQKGKLWSLIVNGQAIYSYSDYKNERAELAPFFLIIGIVSGVFGPLFCWAYIVDRRRKIGTDEKAKQGE